MMSKLLIPRCIKVYKPFSLNHIKTEYYVGKKNSVSLTVGRRGIKVEVCIDGDLSRIRNDLINVVKYLARNPEAIEDALDALLDKLSDLGYMPRGEIEMLSPIGEKAVVVTLD